jgi:hypothetical protein
MLAGMPPFGNKIAAPVRLNDWARLPTYKRGLFANQLTGHNSYALELEFKNNQLYLCCLGGDPCCRTHPNATE